MNLAMAMSHHFETKACVSELFYPLVSMMHLVTVLLVSLLIAESSTSTTMDDKLVRSKKPMSRMEVCIFLFLLYFQNSNSMQLQTTC